MTATLEDDGDGRVTPEVADRINAAMDDNAAREDRILAYSLLVDAMPGQLGTLLRAVGAAHRGYIAAEHANGTTIGEFERLSAIVDEALDTLDWLRSTEGGSGADPGPAGAGWGDVDADTHPLGGLRPRRGAARPGPDRRRDGGRAGVGLMREWTDLELAHRVHEHLAARRARADRATAPIRGRHQAHDAVDDHQLPPPARSPGRMARYLLAVLTMLAVYTGLHTLGWRAAADWTLAGMLALGAVLAVWEHRRAMAATLTRDFPQHDGFADDPELLEQQLAAIRRPPNELSTVERTGEAT